MGRAKKKLERAKAKADANQGDRTVATNRRARHNFEILNSMEAGMVLTGTEIKAIRESKVSLQEAYVRIANEEAWLHNSYIAPYEHAGYAGHDPRRVRKLLLHRRQIRDMEFKVQTKGVTIIPLKLYLTRGLAKIEIGLAKGKRDYDKRQSLKAKDAKRQIERALSQRR